LVVGICKQVVFSQVRTPKMRRSPQRPSLAAIGDARAEPAESAVMAIKKTDVRCHPIGGSTRSLP